MPSIFRLFISQYRSPYISYYTWPAPPFQLFSYFFKKTLAFLLHIQYNQSMSEVILTQNKIHGRIPEWPKGTDCKSAANCFDGSNPSPSICRSGGTGRRPGLKIPWVVIPVPVRFRSAAWLWDARNVDFSMFLAFFVIKYFDYTWLHFYFPLLIVCRNLSRGFFTMD